MDGPAPDPTESYVDPFDPSWVEQFPPAPDWLLPVVMVVFCIAAVTIAVLLVLWSMSRRKSAEYVSSAKKVTADWVDLEDFDPKADPRRPKSPQVVRETPRGKKSKSKKPKPKS